MVCQQGRKKPHRHTREWGWPSYCPLEQVLETFVTLCTLKVWLPLLMLDPLFVPASLVAGPLDVLALLEFELPVTRTSSPT